MLTNNIIRHIILLKLKTEEKGDDMAFSISAALLDAVVLAVVEKQDSYGYKITQEVRGVIDVSESTLYPILRRLLKAQQLESFDKEFDGRNRRYYRITKSGKEQLLQYKSDWVEYRSNIDKLLSVK